MRWTDSFGHVHIRTVDRPVAISEFFEQANKTDSHIQLRQSCLALENAWVTHDCWFRWHTTFVGMNATDIFRLAGHHNLISNGN
jgi:hypothetical protein